MGDRAVIGIKANSNAPTLYIYSHWGGESRYQTLINAIENAGVRAGDTSYFTRIFTSTLIGNDWNQELGWGLSIDSFTCPDYNDIPVVVVEDQELEIYTGSDHEDLELRASFHLDLKYPDVTPEQLEVIAVLATKED
jgi:hypothetical protein